MKWVVVALVAGSVSISGCASTGCPTAASPAERARWASDIRKAPPLSVDPKASISIKRDVHELIVGVDAATFARAFAAVLSDPARRFGLIRVDRLPENVGKDFRVGERFQGRYELAAAGRQQLSGIWAKLFGPVLDDPGVEDCLCHIENGHTSDYGEIVRLDLESPSGGVYSMQYRYLKASPIAGSSTFEVSDITDSEELAALGVPAAARVRQIFLYQEQTESFAKFFTTGGLRLHDQVVYSQVMQAAEAAGTCILKTDIPPEYAAEL
jgi:hypothetical protein